MIFKNKNSIPFHLFFVTILTLNLFISCKSGHLTNYKIDGKQIPITETYNSDKSIDSFVSPYRNHINKDLDIILSYCPETLDKSKGEFQTNIGNLIADACVTIANPLFIKKEKKTIDGAIFNHGGIRSIIPKGNVSKRTAFEVMPFENSLVVVALKGDQIYELANYFVKERKPHPLNGIHITIGKNNLVNQVLIHNEPIDQKKTYFILTSDYLANGGDNMSFFLKNEGKFDLEYKMRNVLIDYFTSHKIIEADHSERVIKIQ